MTATRMNVDELCRVELIAEIKSDTGKAPVQTYRSRNVAGSVCDVVVKQGPLGKSAFCVQHNKSDDCEGAARVLCAIDFAARGITSTGPEFIRPEDK